MRGRGGPPHVIPFPVLSASTPLPRFASATSVHLCPSTFIYCQLFRLSYCPFLFSSPFLLSSLSPSPILPFPFPYSPTVLPLPLSIPLSFPFSLPSSSTSDSPLLLLPLPLLPPSSSPPTPSPFPSRKHGPYFASHQLFRLTITLQLHLQLPG